ncbi:alpha/beta hydrolase [Pseudomonadota bacterium]
MTISRFMILFRSIVCCSLFLSAVPAAFASFTIPNTTVVEVEDSDRTYNLYIKLPNSYNQIDKLKSYPVIYMTDAVYSLQVVSGVTRLSMDRTDMQQAILVAVSGQQGRSPAASRMRDYTPSVDTNRTQATGEAQRHMQLFANKIIPYMNQHYRTQPWQNTYVGHALGGLFGAYILRNKPALFNNYVLASPPFWFDNQRLLKQFREPEFITKSINANVFIGVGELETAENSEFGQDMVADAKSFYQLLQQKNRLTAANGSGINAKLMLMPVANHSMAFPMSAIYGLDWLFDAKTGVSGH